MMKYMYCCILMLSNCRLKKCEAKMLKMGFKSGFFFFYESVCFRRLAPSQMTTVFDFQFEFYVFFPPKFDFFHDTSNQH